MPEISVIVPVYNAELYLERCINSILGQSFADFELLLMDDGSIDNSPAICDEMREKDSRIRVIHKQNTGVSDTRNQAIKLAQGKYIMFADADDYMSEEMLQTMYQVIKKTNCDMAMCGYYIDSTDKSITANMQYDDEYVTHNVVKDGLLKRYYECDQVGLYSLWNKIFRKDLIVENQIEMDVNLARAEDAWFVFEYLKVCNNVQYIPTPLYYYYQNPNSAMHQVRLDQYEKWVYTRNRLLTENETLQINLDYQKFYSGFCYKVCIYLRDLIKMGETIQARRIMQDEFYLNAIKCAKSAQFPVHIRMLTIPLLYGLVVPVYMIYKIWAKL